MLPLLAAPEVIPEPRSRSVLPSLAVLTLAANGQVSTEVATIMTDRLRGLLLQQGTYQMMERTQMTAILREQGFQASMLDCSSTACALELGKLLSVRYLLVGSISQLGQVYTLNARLLDAQTGQIMQERFVDCRCSFEELLTTQAPRLASQLAQPVQHTAPPKTQALSPVEFKSPITAALLNIPGPLGYVYLEEWGWMAAMLAIDVLGALLLLDVSRGFSTNLLFTGLILGGTRVFGLFHAPVLAGAHNAEAARLSELPKRSISQATVPLVAWQISF